MKRFNPYKMFNGSFIPEAVSKISNKDLSGDAKNIYGRLARYAGKDGICRPKRTTLMSEVGLHSLSTLDRKIKELCDIGLIEINQRGLQKSNEYFFLFNPDIFGRFDDTDYSDLETTETPDLSTPIVRESVEDSIYNKYTTLPDSFGKTPLKRISKFYSLIWKRKFDMDYKTNFGLFGKTLGKLQDLTEIQICSLIIVHFDWRGSLGTDEFLYKKLLGMSFPFEWIPNSQNAYKVFLKEMGVDFADNNTVYEFVKRHIK